MSRTDKDLPYWFADSYEPKHYCIEHGRDGYVLRRNKHCDLDELTYKNLRKWGNRRTHSCYWVPVKELGKKHWYDTSPGWWYHIVWLEPERARVRDSCHSAMLDYNANGDTDVDVANFRKKHRGGWYW